MTAAAGADLDELCFAARALAQSHAMTESAHRYRQTCLERERLRQPVSELADWAGTALLVGYCLRRSEESRTPETELGAPAARDHDIDLGDIEALTESLRVGDASSVALLPAEAIVTALDRIVATELDKRREHLHEQLDEASWLELEDYIAWWVVHGYALRASERPKR
ncbi:MAG: hypothetical protein OXH42_10010 [Acidimicrobiaceae bacterium]|nr:hypothetical protein [Acidimicrobiaceae bacterium]